MMDKTRIKTSKPLCEQLTDTGVSTIVNPSYECKSEKMQEKGRGSKSFVDFKEVSSH
jgi:hypothetical protein